MEIITAKDKTRWQNIILERSDGLPGVLDLPLLHLVDDHPVLPSHHHLPKVALPHLEGILCRNQLAVTDRVSVTIHSIKRYLSSFSYHLDRAGATQARQHRYLTQRHILQKEQYLSTAHHLVLVLKYQSRGQIRVECSCKILRWDCV